MNGSIIVVRFCVLPSYHITSVGAKFTAPKSFTIMSEANNDIAANAANDADMQQDNEDNEDVRMNDNEDSVAENNDASAAENEAAGSDEDGSEADDSNMDDNDKDDDAKEDDAKVPTTILEAVECQNVVVLTSLLVEDPSGVNVTNAQDQTPLSLALHIGNFDVVLVLIAHGADIKYVDAQGNNILMNAVHFENSQALLILLQMKCFDVNDMVNLQYQTPLSLAAERGNLGMMLLLINHGANTKYIDPEGNTVLMKALCNSQVVELLLSRAEVDANATNALQKTAIMMAIEQHCKKSFEILLLRSVDLEVVDITGKTALLYAIFQNETDMALKLLEHQQAIVDSVQGWCSVPLVAACRLNTMAIATALLAKGAAVDVADKDGVTPLVALCSTDLCDEEDMLKVATILIASGANVNITDQANTSILMHACKNHHYQLAGLLLQKKALPNVATLDTGMTPLLEVLASPTCEARVEFIKLLLANEADPMSMDCTGITALMFACKSGYDEIANILIDRYGAEVDAQSGTGETALLLACLHNKLSIIPSLLQKGASLSLVNAKGRTPLLALYAESNYSSNDFFLAVSTSLYGNNGVAITTPDAAGRTPLMYVCDNSDLSWVVDIILPRSNVNASDDLGVTALMLSVTCGTEEVMKTLIAGGANVNARCALDETVLLKACANKNASIITFLLQNPFLQVDVASCGKTPLSVLCESPTEETDNFINDLLDRGANPNGTAPWGDPPMLSAVVSKKKELAWLLACRGGDVNAVGSDGYSRAILAACKHGDFGMVQMLVEMGVDVNVIDENGSLPCMLACEAQAKNPDDDLPDIVHYLLINGGGRGVTEWLEASRNHEEPTTAQNMVVDPF